MSQDEIRLSSKDLELLLHSGNLNFDQVDFMQLDPAVAQQLMQIKQVQQQDPNVNASAYNRPKPAKPAPATSSSMPVQQQQRPPARGTHIQGPYVEIMEQPKARGLRFRYECEGRSAGSIPGENSTPERKTFPTIKIHNYSGPAVIVVSCVTKEEPYKPHPHNLVGKDCKKGVCTLRIRDTTTVSFPHLGIQCAKKKDVEGNLKMRQEINVDPFQTGFKHKGTNIDLNVVRLCFQVFLPDEQGKITRIVPPVCSQLIHDRKALNDLVICRIDRTSGKPKGGDEVFLLCEKINRDDVRVRFYEENEGKVYWEAFGDFGQNDVHRQYAIVFKTPPYREQFLTQPVEVNMQLQRSSDCEGSDPISFTYQPEDPDPDRILEKRKRKAASLTFLQEPGNGNISQEALKQRLKLKATRTSRGPGIKAEATMVKEEVQSPTLPQYSFSNTGSQKTAADLGGALHVAASSSGILPSVGVPGQYNPGLQQQQDVTAATVSSQMAMSGGKVQYNQVPTSQQPPQPQPSQVPSITLTPQLIQLLQQSGLVTTQQPNISQAPVPPQQPPIQSNPPLQNPNPAANQPESNPQIEALKQYLMHQVATQQQQPNVNNPGADNTNPVLINSDPNLNQEIMSSLGSLDPNILQSLMAGDSPMVSFESLEGLSGALSNVEGDQNVAMFEVVGGDASNQGQSQQPMQQQFDEATSAVQNLN